MKYFLALETSMEQGSLGVFQIEKKQVTPLIVKEWSSEIHQGRRIYHSEKLPLQIQLALNEIQLNLKDLHFFAVGVGPGRFTGVRTSVNIIRTLAFLLKIPTYPVNSLKIVGEAFLNSQSDFCVAFNGFKNLVYFAEFSKGKIQGEPEVMDVSKWVEYMLQTKKKFCVGDVEDFYSIPPELKKQCQFEQGFPSVTNLAQIVCRDFNPAELKPWFQLEPLYLRSVIEETP